MPKLVIFDKRWIVVLTEMSEQYDLIKKTRNRFATSPNDDDDEYIGDRP